ncbi:sulfite exporter TauE/SafE family protein [Tistrella sp.]|nr:sulfite exporter TauE/SafE family protein [Tistrella sp.]MAD36089.1 hypothetical protein [Tistrella sp.]
MSGTLLIVVPAVFAAAILRGITGFGFALAAVPLMSLAVPPAQAVAVALLLQSFVGLRDVVALRADTDHRTLAFLSLGAVLGTMPGIWLLDRLSPDVMRIVIAGVVMLGLAVLIGRPQGLLRPGRGSAVGAGLVAGLFSGLAAMPGPPAIAYFLGTATPAKRVRASLMVFFFFTSLMALPGLALAGQLHRDQVIAALVALPALIVGTWAGGRVFARLSEGNYRRAAIGLLAITAGISALRGLNGLP